MRPPVARQNCTRYAHPGKFAHVVSRSNLVSGEAVAFPSFAVFRVRISCLGRNNARHAPPWDERTD